MAEKIFKYTLLVTDEKQGVSMPYGAEVVRVGAQGEDVCFWAVVDTLEDDVRREFYVVGTGDTFPEYDLLYIGSAQTDLGLVWHVLEA